MTNSRELMISVQSEVAQANVYDLYTNTLSPITKVNYVSTIKSFFGVNDLSEISISDMQSVTPDVANVWANRQLMSGIAKSTINRKLSAMYNFYEYLCRRNVGIMTYNPFSTSQGCVRFKNTTKDYSDKRALSPKEMQKMLKAVEVSKTDDKDRVVAYRDLVVLQILLI